MKASLLLTKEQQDHIREAIKEAEGETSGEIRVHIETRISGDVLDRAAWIFKRIGMHKTESRNGVLFYLAVENRKFAIIGDRGINTKVPDGFWDNIKDMVAEEFSKGNFTQGLAKGILAAGLKLKEHFPHSREDVNELPDNISFDEVPE
jgi:uncharacterized membrane protein